MNVLQRIIQRKHQEVAQLHADDAMAQVCGEALPTERSFVSALRSQSPALLAEVKPKSPSAGELLRRDRVPALVDVYNHHAQAISILCDHEDFGGGFNLLQEVRHLTELPLLAKEFIIDPIQIQLARASGADAILLIAAVLDKAQVRQLAQIASSLHMAVLLELHDHDDLQKIPAMNADTLVLGINNRNLQDLSIDLATTESLAPKLRSDYPDHLLLSESGIEDRADVERLQSIVDGFLIGTTLIQADDAETKIHHLFPS